MPLMLSEQLEKEKIGSFGDITCFSFDGKKNITSGEGGCLVSNDKCDKTFKDISWAFQTGLIKDIRVMKLD